MKLERYITPEYLESQKELHRRPKGYGGGGAKWADAVSYIIHEHNCLSMLDYGCGQGMLAKNLLQRSDLLIDIFEYDPAIKGKEEIEKWSEYDLVVCTDVMEHIEPDRLGVVIDHLFRLAKKVLFLVIATRPSNKFFPDGRNVHLTIEPASWWMERLNHPSFEILEPPSSPMDQASREFVCLFGRKK